MLQVGDTFGIFSPDGIITERAFISRLSDASIWYTTKSNNRNQRVSRKTFMDCIIEGTFRKI
jgi:hypothetical protein